MSSSLLFRIMSRKEPLKSGAPKRLASLGMTYMTLFKKDEVKFTDESEMISHFATLMSHPKV